jgi:RNA polymerase sigma factor (TIGR02999 family)
MIQESIEARTMNEVTQILSAIESGEPHAADELLPMVYTELRRLAAHKMANERPGQTLQATALVHEAWQGLVREEDRAWKNSQHFFRAAATAMRRILINNARRKKTPKHGGHLQRVELDHATPAAEMPSDDLLAVGDALERLEKEDAEAARLVELRFFVGMGHQEAAGIMGISRRQADDVWAYARAWLLAEIEKDFRANDAPTLPE